MTYKRITREDIIHKYEENPYEIRKGQKVFWKELTKTAQLESDCEIYRALEKYGLQTPEMLPESMFDNDAFIGDIEEYQDLRGNLEKKIKAQDMWEKLPIAIREKFGHDINNFVDNAQKYLEELKTDKEKRIKREQIINIQPTETIKTDTTAPLTTEIKE